MDADRYLNKNFEFKNLKVAELRGILAENNVEFPSKAKKSVLIGIYKTHIYRNIPQLRASYNLPELEDQKIETGTDSDDVVSESDSTDKDSTSRESSLRTSTYLKKRKLAEITKGEENENKMSDKVAEEVDKGIGISSTPKKKKQKQKNVTDTSVINEKLANKSPIKIDSPRKTFYNESTENSVDTSNDSFLSKSVVIDSSLGNKESLQGVQRGTPRSDLAYRRRTIAPDLAGLNVSPEFRNQLQKAVDDNNTKLDKRKNNSNVLPKKVSGTSNDSTTDTIEKDTPRKKVDVNRKTTEKYVDTDMNLKDKTNVKQTKSQSKSSNFVTIVRNTFVFLLILLPILFSLWYREQRILTGFCGRELPTKKIFSDTLVDHYPFAKKIDNWLYSFVPTCIECPENAICYQNLNIKCEPEYYLTSDLYTLYGLLPISRRCIKDDKRAKLVDEVVKKSLEILRTQNAQFDCGENSDETISGFSEQELYNIFKESKALWINDEEFDKIWDQVISNLKNELEISWRQLNDEDTISEEGGNIKETNVFQGEKGNFQEHKKKTRNCIFRSSSKKYIGLRCQFERQIYQTYLKYRQMIWSVLLLLICMKFMEHIIRKHFEQRVKIETTTKNVIQYLKIRKTQVNSDPKQTSYVSTVQLRDVFLADIVSLKAKNAIWEKVSKNIENNNTNIKSSLLEIHGEIMKCWEWIGTINLDNNDNIQEPRQ